MPQLNTYSNILSSFNVSTTGTEFICENHPNDNIVSVSEFITHDGYDRFGPQSNLHDLFVIVKDGGIYKYYYYKRENWFNNSTENDNTYSVEQKIKTSVFMEIKKLSDWAKFLQNS
jgi:hypothetical protein